MSIHKYTAASASGKKLAAGTFAENEEEARRKITNKLQANAVWSLLRVWREGGKQLIAEEI